jgi:hypothetical protein
MVVDVVAVHVVKVPFVQLIGVPFMPDRRVAAARPVDMTTVIRML